MLKLATWNVNSIRVRLPQVLEWAERNRPDVLCLQETKVTDDEFPTAAVRAAGYHAYYAGQKSYNGVATLTRLPAEAIVTGLPGFDPTQKRFLTLTTDGVRVANVYVPNGEAVASEKYAYKLAWLKALDEHLAQELKAHPLIALVGDFNIAPEDRDVHDPKLWRGQVLCSEPERAALQALLDRGLVDTFRKFEQPPESFTWWDYRMGAFRRGHGLRIDHILCTATLARQCRTCTIDKNPRAASQPSDHAPVSAEFAL